MPFTVAPKNPQVTPIPVGRALRVLGEHVSAWRKLNRLTAAQVAERANISRDTSSCSPGCSNKQQRMRAAP
jgi:hypothetical protein